MASICCSPPDIVPPFWRSRSLRRGNSVEHAVEVLLDPGLVTAQVRPQLRFSYTVMREKTCRPSGEWATPMRDDLLRRRLA